MVRLKQDVTGFIFDFVHGCVEKIFTEPMTTEQKKGINDALDMCGMDSSFMDDNDDINDLFPFRCKEDLENDVEGLNKVVEWVD